MSTRRVTRLRDDWKFTRTNMPNATATACDDAGWETVQVPHDWAISGPFDQEHDADRKVRKGQADVEDTVQVITGRSGGLPHIGEGWYRRPIDIPAASKGRVFRLECDGIMSHSRVYCNGEFAGSWPYGYSSFAFDITPYIRPGEKNVIAVHVNNPGMSSRWYPGAGIYREVRLVELPPTHIDHWGVAITTPQITDDEGQVTVRTRLRTQLPRGQATGGRHGGRPSTDRPLHDLRNGGSGAVPTADVNAVVLRTTVLNPGGDMVCQDEASRPVADSETFEQSLTVTSPERWSLDTPAQYTVVSEVLVEGDVVDRLDTRFGFRDLEFDVDRGFFLNGQPVKMKGVCMHHDLGPLGTAVNTAALRRQLTLLKEMGCNAIRTSHNPPAPELPALASEMGILIIDEAFDEWKYTKMKNGYNTLWDEWAEKDLRALIKRDRNHPAVIMWSIGNEITEQWKDDGGEISQFLVDICHDEDPTRPTTAGLNRAVAGPQNRVADTLDVPGWNYQPHEYVHAHTRYAGKPMYGAETASTVSSRGEYYFPAVDEVHVRRDTLQVNSYDMSYPSWATAPDIEFRAQDECDFIMGEFVWTGFDYLGEPTPYNEEWPSRSSYFGIIDLGGIPKDRFYLYQSHWSEKDVLHLLPHWTWPGHEGQPVPVHCYTSFNHVELFVNGTSMGRRSRYPKYKVLESQYRFHWDTVPYEPGELKVIAYDKAGNVAGEHTVATAGDAAALELIPDRSQLEADGDDMAFVTVRIVDDAGHLSPRADHPVRFSVEGPAEIAAVCNGDATSLESFTDTHIKAFNGLCMVYLRSVDGQAGTVSVTASAEGLAPATAQLGCGCSA